MKVLDGRGEVLSFGGQVMKNVAGYDVSRLLAGSLGTLALILDVSLKVLPKPVAEATLALGSGIPFGLVVYFVLLWVLDPTAFRGIRRHALMVLRPRTV